ncbi:MAG: sulfur carrier protein ThiS adenylyltransferase [Litorilinea sp.]|nr:MAG: sulfur carrier protein ThiS adenylyltransferase [Litorilinea sp.]
MMNPEELARYHRQIIFPPVGEDGQQRLKAATAVVVGCGATGSALSNLLVRAGVGRVRIVDRDFIELNNLQRQILFDEEDIAANLPKAEAAARKLRRVNRDVTVEAVVADVNPGNVLDLLADATVVLDGTDNFSTRFLLNDACLHLGKAWIYTGVIASYGMTATFIPDGAVATLPGERQATGCLRCLLGTMPAPGVTPTCDTAGVIGPAVALITAVAAAETMKLIIGRGKLNPGVIHMDLWTHEYHSFGGAIRRPDCPACGLGRLEYLDATVGTASATLCGRNAVQVRVNGSGPLDLARLEAQLRPVASRLARNDYLLRAQIGDYEFTVFPDNRAIIKGTEDEDLAKSLYARYIGG